MRHNEEDLLTLQIDLAFKIHTFRVSVILSVTGSVVVPRIDT